jgi:hypothetical protein
MAKEVLVKKKEVVAIYITTAAGDNQKKIVHKLLADKLIAAGKATSSPIEPKKGKKEEPVK